MSTSKGHNVGEGGFLKTTTWGALIALSLAAVAWGVSSYTPLAHNNEDGQASVALNRPVEDSSPSPAQAAPKHESFFTDALKHASRLNPFSASKTSANKNALLSAQVQSPASGPLTPASALKPASHLEDTNQSPTFGAQESDEAKAALAARKISPDLKSVKPEASVDVIVQFHQPPSAADLLGEDVNKKAELPLVKAELVTVKGANLSSLASHANVADIAYSHGWNGTGVGIAVVDSGVGSVDDLNSDGNLQPSRVVYSQSFVVGDASTADGYGHGTHVAGIIAGNSYDSSTGYQGVYRGIAPEAQIINLRALDSTGAGTDSTVIAAIQQAIALQNTYNIRVLNLSIGRQVYESYTIDPLCQAVEAAWNAGIVVVVAAGNSGRDTTLGTNGYATIGAPANDPYVITVGASNLHGTGLQTAQTVASYSSKGPTLLDHIAKPDLVAPGNRVVSLLAANTTLPNTYPLYDIYPCDSSDTICGSQYGPAQYMRLSGTSMATPAVSAAAALLLQQNALLTPDQVKARLMKTAWKGYGQYYNGYDTHERTYSLQHDLFAVGAGYLDVAAEIGRASCRERV